MFGLLRHLLLAAILLLGLGAHGAALGQGGVPPSSEVTHEASVHTAVSPCADAEVAELQGIDCCCGIGHCPPALAADSSGPVLPFAAVRPVAVESVLPSAEPQGNPERPPRMA